MVGYKNKKKINRDLSLEKSLDSKKTTENQVSSFGTGSRVCGPKVEVETTSGLYTTGRLVWVGVKEVDGLPRRCPLLGLTRKV